MNIEDMRQKNERDQRLLKWTREGATNDGDTYVDEDLVWWGYWRVVGGEEADPPDVLFPTEKEALAFAELIGKAHDWHVGPCVLRIESRDNSEAPA